MKDLPKFLRIMTDAQSNEIVELYKAGHGKSIVNFGGEMYRWGLVDATLFCVAFTTVCYAAHRVKCRIKKEKEKQDNTIKD